MSRFFIQEQIIGLPQGGVQQYNDGPDQQRQQYVLRGSRQEQEHQRQHRQHEQHHPVVDRAAHDHQGLVAQEVEEQPRDHHDYEHDQRYGVPEEAQEEHQEDDDGVVHAEVGGVDLHSVDCFLEVGRELHGVNVEHQFPRVAGAEASFDAFFGA